MMTLKKESLDTATAARDTLLEHEHQVERARVDYHHAIRRLHADGGSLREIAEAMGISHQRVHQIVDPGDDGPRPGPGRGPGRGRGPGAGPGRGPGGPRRPGDFGPPEGFGGPGMHEGLHRLRRRMRSLVSLERFTSDARAAVLAGVEAAQELGHRRVGSEHLLIGVASAPSDDPAVRVLAARGIDRKAVTAAVTGRLVTGDTDPGRRRPFTPAARRVLEHALAIARDRGDDHIGGQHILRALVADDGDAAEVLAGLGAAPRDITQALDQE